MSVYDFLERIKGLISEYGDVKIGIEKLQPDSFPLLRVVPNQNSLDDGLDHWAQDIYLSIYIGKMIDEPESAFKWAYDIENKIFNKLHNFQFDDGGLIRFVESKRVELLDDFLIIESSYFCDSFRL
ncbi:hypothetical protein [Campylobacter hominis]